MGTPKSQNTLTWRFSPDFSRFSIGAALDAAFPGVLLFLDPSQSMLRRRVDGRLTVLG